MRRRSGLTQEQLGALTGYSAATISRLETGRQPLHDIATLRHLATALNIPPGWLGLADNANLRQSPTAPANAPIPPAASTATRHACRVNPRLLPTAERYARYCVDTARAWHSHGDRDRAVDALLAAERAAPEEVRRPSVATLISTMRYAPGPVSSSLHGLAARTQDS